MTDGAKIESLLMIKKTIPIVTKLTGSNEAVQFKKETTVLCTNKASLESLIGDLQKISLADLPELRVERVLLQPMWSVQHPLLPLMRTLDVQSTLAPLFGLPGPLA